MFCRCIVCVVVVVLVGVDNATLGSGIPSPYPSLRCCRVHLGSKGPTPSPAFGQARPIVSVVEGRCQLPPSSSSKQAPHHPWKCCFLTPPPSLYTRRTRGQRWLRGHNSPPPLGAAFVALRGVGTVTLVGGGGSGGHRPPRAVGVFVGVGWMDGVGGRWEGSSSDETHPRWLVVDVPARRRCSWLCRPRGWTCILFRLRSAAQALQLIYFVLAAPPRRCPMLFVVARHRRAARPGASDDDVEGKDYS